MSPIPKGSTVLVTGANGYVASHVVDQLLAAGYKVKGTVRSEAKGEWLTDYFTKKYGDDKLKLVVVPDMSAPGAFDEALQGTDGVAHVASDVTFNSDPEKVIPAVESAVTQILASAAKVPTIKRFVLTSSSAAAVFPIPDKEFTVGKDDFNEFSLEQAWSLPADDPSKAYHVYCASKVAGEKALWKFVDEHKPSFEVNTVLPNFVSGEILGRQWGQPGSTGGAVVNLYAGKTEEEVQGAIGFLQMVPPQWLVDVGDVGLLHVAGLTDPDIVSERIWGFGYTYNNPEILAALKKAKPDHKFPAEFGPFSHDLSKIEGRGRAEEILKKISGRGFKTVEESVGESVRNL